MFDFRRSFVYCVNYTHYNLTNLKKFLISESQFKVSEMDS